MANDDERECEPGAGVEDATIDDDLPLVSIIVRSIGRVTLEEALDSIAAQTYSNIEVIVVNASGPDHPHINASCGRFPVRVAGGAEPLPRGRAANIGLEAARGAYVGFLDDDDWLYGCHVASLVGSLRAADPAVLVAYADVVTSNGDHERESHFGGAFSGARLMAENYIPLHAAIFSTLLRDRGCVFDENLEVFEDWDFWLQAARQSPFCYLPRVTAVYRSGGGSRVGLSPDSEQQSRHRARVFEKWKDVWGGAELGEMVEFLNERYRQAVRADIELRGEIESIRTDLRLAREKYDFLQAQVAGLTGGWLGGLWKRWVGWRLRH